MVALNAHLNSNMVEEFHNVVEDMGQRCGTESTRGFFAFLC
jgi:hypothetical protein